MEKVVLKNIEKSDENVVCGVKISNGNRVIFPEKKIDKLDVARYYEIVSNKILKEIKNRPLSVIRCHGNLFGEKFFKKHAQKNEDVERIFVKNNGKNQEYFFIKTKNQLINQIQLGTIEFHVASCKNSDLNYPDFIVFDLDPDENVDVEKLRKATRLVKKILNELKIKCFLKTSGGKGYHVCAKIENLTYNKAFKLSKQIAEILEQKYPEIFVTNLKKQVRKNKIFIDYLRNKKGATCVSAYSLRLRENATISMPISWKNLDKILPNEINILNFQKYL